VKPLTKEAFVLERMKAGSKVSQAEKAYDKYVNEVEIFNQYAESIEEEAILLAETKIAIKRNLLIKRWST